jgi:hypothetical protein
LSFSISSAVRMVALAARSSATVPANSAAVAACWACNACAKARSSSGRKIDHRQRHGPSYHRADSGREKDRKAPFR